MQALWKYGGRMKYGLIAAVIAVVALFYFMSQSNKADAERLKQAEIAHQQKLEQDKANEANLEQASLARQVEAEKAKALKVEQAQLGSEKKARELEQAAKQNAALQANKPVVKENKYPEEEWMSICKSAAGAAKAIMTNRQRGVAMTEMMDKVVRPAEPAIKDIVKAFVIDAYSRPRYDTPENQQKSVLDFENSAYLTCVKVRQ